jgi:hypothetical protein
MSERPGKINAAGDFLRGVGSRRGGAQGAFDAPSPLPVIETLSALATAAPPGSSGVNVDALAAELAVSRSVLAETLSNLSELDLIALLREGREERALLTDLGTIVLERQRERSDSD